MPFMRKKPLYKFFCIEKRAGRQTWRVRHARDWYGKPATDMAMSSVPKTLPLAAQTSE